MSPINGIFEVPNHLHDFFEWCSVSFLFNKIKSCFEEMFVIQHKKNRQIKKAPLHIPANIHKETDTYIDEVLQRNDSISGD